MIETCWPAEREALDALEARYNPILAQWQGCREHAQEYGSTDEPNASRMKALEVELETLREERRVIHEACLAP